jgi:homoserine kinase type II
MANRTHFSSQDIAVMLAEYDLGALITFRPFETGMVQSNLFIETTRGAFVLRYYENRPPDHARHEMNLLQYLSGKDFPCPQPMRNRHGRLVGLYQEKPFALISYLPGKHIGLEQLDWRQLAALIEKIAILHKLTRHYRPRGKPAYSYNVTCYRQEARRRAALSKTASGRNKLAWVEAQLDALVLPQSLPKGVCHCDFCFTNILWEGRHFVRLIDFDDADRTYLLYDLWNMIDWFLWPRNGELDFTAASRILCEYAKHRAFTSAEHKHFFDVYKLGIIGDCTWSLDHDEYPDFKEKRKIEYLDGIGREAFQEAIFG